MSYKGRATARKLYVWFRQSQVMVWKELRQLTRDVPLFLFIVFIFTLNIIMAAGEASTELKDARIVVHDADHSEASRDLIYRFRPPEFTFAGEVRDPTEGQQQLETGSARLFVDIPEHFARRIARGEAVSVQVLVDTSKSNIGFQASGMAAMITARFAQEWAAKTASRRGPSLVIPAIENRSRIWYNPALNQSWEGMLVELLSMVLVACILLPGAAFIREKERGTIEQLLVSPISPLQVMLAKIVAMMTVTIVGSAISLLVIMRPMFGFPVNGSLLLFAALTVLFAFACSAFGLAAATYARTSGQVGMLILLISMPMAILSGLRSPLESMPGWLQALTLISPLRHYVEIAYSILLRGGGMEVVWTSVLWLAGLGCALFLVSLYRFRRQFR